MKKPFTLIGLKGVGKTTLGQYLSCTCHCRWVDSDQVMLKQFYHRFSQKELYLLLGEKKFREVEQHIIFSIKNTDILTLGGGALSTSKMQNHLKQTAYIIYLKTTFPYYQNLNRGAFIHYPEDEKKAFEFYQSRCHIYESLAHQTIDISQTDEQVKYQLTQLYNERK